MFELTGALTYILPTMVSSSFSTFRQFRAYCVKTHELTCASQQIVVMVTKAVSDQFGGGGIADQMIRFNGFPLLENEDHAYNVTGVYYLHPRDGEVLMLLSSCCGDEARNRIATFDWDEAR